MVVDQRTLRANMLRNNIGANVFNKLTGQQAQTPAQQPTQQAPVQQQPETYKVITNKFPTYDIKDLMGFGPQAVKNQLGFANSMSHYNKLQAQADANTDPNVRYNLTKPQLTNKETLQIEQATPETNEQGLKINKTNSFKDLVADLQNVANQGRNLEFVKFRDLYPEYVENWDKVVDLFESIKSNPQYSAEQVTTTAQKAYPELFGINENYSDKDKMTALKKLYDEMVSNKQNGIQLTQQDIIDRYPEYANTEDINTVMELQDFINKDKKTTPTFIDVVDISDQFKSLAKGNSEYGNTEQKQISNDLKSLDKIDANIYNYLSDEGQDYVKTLALAKEIGDMVRKDYRVPDNISDYDLLMKVKDEMPEVYSELTKGLNITNELSDYDRKIFNGETTGKKFAQQSIKKIGGNLMAVLGPDAVKGLGILSNRLGDLVESGFTGISNKLENATGNRGIFENTEGISEGSHALGDTLIRASGWLKDDLESQNRYQEFLQEQGAEKAKGAGINFKGYKNAIKEGDMKGIRDTFVKDINEAKDLGWGTWTSKNLGSLAYLLPSMFAGTKAEMFLSFLPSGVGRAYEDYANDEGIKANLTDKQIQDRAILAGGLESLIEVMETPFRKGKRGSFMENFPGMRNAIVRAIMMTEKGAVGEGLEEVAQEFSNRLIAKASGSERDLGTLDEYLDIFAETVSSSQIVSLLGGSAEGIDQQKLNNLEQQIAEDTEYRNKILEGQAFVANDFNEFANAVEVVPGTTTEELQQVWNNAQQKKQDLEQKANNITSNSYNNVNVPTYERTTVKDTVKPKITANESQQYADLLDEMEKNGEITKEDRKKVEEKLGIFTRNVEQPKTEGLANIQKTNETKSETSTEEKRNIIDRIVDKGASIVTKTVSAQDKLYKAQEPRMNVLSNKKNLEKRRANSDRANELIVENGYKPTNTEERLNAHQATLNKLWDQVKEQVKQGEGITVDQTPIINALSEYIAEKKKLGIAGIESEIKALERELNAMKKSQEQGKTDLPVLEQKKQVFNDMIDWKEQEASEVYKGGLRLLTHEIGKVEDDLISKIPGEFTKLKQDVGALLDTYEDVFKAHMKNQRSKGIGLTETYSRIEGIGDMLQGIIGVFKGEGGKVISGAGKVLLGKSLARAKDVDFLIKKGFEELSNEMGSNTKNDNDTTTDKNDTPPTKPNKPKNNGPKPQTQPETEKKSEKKTDKAEQVQAKKKNNQNTKPKTKGLAKINETKEETKTEGLVEIDETKSQSESKIDNRVQEQPLFNIETKQKGLATISVKVENGKVVKESNTQENENIETPQEFEVLPADVSVYDESKVTGPKRISPDRGGWWQQLTPKEAIDKKIEQITKDRQRRTEQYDKKLDILNGYIEKFGDSISQNDRSKEATEARKTIRNEIINPYRLGNFFTAGALGQIKEVFERWKSQQNAEITDKNREDINRDYIQHVKEDISHGYRYPEAVLSYNPEFRTAVDNRARYEKGLYTSFSTDDTRIVDYKKDQIGAGMKRQDGKELTQEQKDEIANGVINYQETMGIDIKRLAENNNWVYVHLNGKNPFLMGSQGGIAGLYRGSVDEKGRSTASVSVGGTESYQVREDGKIVTKKKKTTMAHELTHALDALSSRKLLSESAYNDLRLKFNDYDSRGLHHSSYWTSKSEITARMIEEYVAVQNGDTEMFNEKGYWDQETYNNVIEPEINKIKNNFFQEYKEGIGGDSIEQIKADAVTRGLADISNQ